MKLFIYFILFILSSVQISFGGDFNKSTVVSTQYSQQKTEKQVEISIKKGMSFNSVARVLKNAGLIGDIFYFKALATLLGKSTKVQSGEYIFKINDSYFKILNTLVEGKVYLHSITFPEGYNMYEIASALEKQNFLKSQDFISLCYNLDLIKELLNLNISSLEGYLFPDTYRIPKPVDPEVLIRKMVQGFLKVYNQISKDGQIQASSDSYYLNRHQAVNLASIVEKETGLAQERPLIASVFYNRLKNKMRLESDPTILYGMMREVNALVPLNIRKKDILKKTPYNTYRIFGFPAGPISNPGFQALQAVFKPEHSSFFYFVSRNDGSHVFSKTYKEHKKQVNRYQKLKK